MSTTEGEHKSGLLLTVQPGTGIQADFEPFDTDHTIERIVGSMSHNGDGVTASTTQTRWFPFTIAARKLPVSSVQDGNIDLYDSKKGDDHFFRMDTVCNAQQSNPSTPNWHEVNSKSKRTFDVGDKMEWLWSIVSPFTDTNWSIDVAINLRILWKLKS